ncbi:hypothetical protein BT63DRAFT_449121 [Microthyrium microscopicum]|uniref:Zn(2)-C6 fungal-type domain-containing protein n=1 Tax=Microthyrium microscopicum TaxID=703497 RepID=A0A6A6URN5_9PEZI|nr:hypothetical protein BT63DRAFT_449121 [Microthyrium microscopicum]
MTNQRADNGSNTAHVQKRARQQLSCMPCRTGKLKCDRQQPCDQCLKRARDSSCTYLPPPKKKPRRPMSTKERISHLETLLIQMMNNDQSPTADGREETTESVQQHTPESTFGESPGRDDLVGTGTLGKLQTSNGETSYVGSTHWEAVLAGISELKAALGTEAFRTPSPSPEDRLLVLGRPTVTREYLLKCCPPREVSEKLLWHLFNSTNPLTPSIHRPTFSKEYDQYLENPSKTPTVWLALFFSMLSLGSSMARFHKNTEGNTANNDNNAEKFISLANEALVLSDITRPQKYVIEALVMHIGSIHVRSHADDQFRIWIICGVLLRLCLKMGYHRDPSYYPFLTPFEGEMRRRIWHNITIFDHLLSFSVGLPSMIRDMQCDTKLPRNLQDGDFGPDTKELPQGRPFVELTAVAFIIVKATISRLFARAADVSHAVEHPNFDEVTALDKELDVAYNAIPDSLKFLSLHQCILDPPAQIFNRFKLHLLYYKSRLVLFRRYLDERSCSPAEEPFRNKCVDAAMKLLSHLDTVHRASQPGGQLESLPFFLDIFSVHDFLLCAMILCLELIRLRKKQTDGESSSPERIASMKALLECTYQTYITPGTKSRVPVKALEALRIILNKAIESPVSSNTLSPQSLPYVTPSVAATSVIDANPRISQEPANFAASGLFNVFEPIGDILNLESNQTINWQMLDTFAQNQQQQPMAQLNEFDFGNTAQAGAEGGDLVDPSLQYSWYYPS